MDDILNLGDISNFLDISNSICDDEILQDFDSLDFVNNFDDDLIFDYDTNKHLDNLDLYKTVPSNNFYDLERNNCTINENVNNYGNTKPSEINVKNESKETAEQKLMIIREIVDSNTLFSSNGLISSLVNNTDNPVINKKALISSRIGNQKSNPYKLPVILPAKNISSTNLLKSPTLAATLISSQPAKSIDTYGSQDDLCNETPGRGRVVRRNSHNAIEKRYRLSINDKIDELRQMLFLGDDSKMNKSNVLKKAIERIKFLEDENNALRCGNYNLRISRNLPTANNGNSIESLIHTNSSPSSSNSDSGRSIENSPSSSSMNSSSITSGCLFIKSNETDSQKLSNPPVGRGLKRPLIYNSNGNNNDNSININKNEKLARLLLDTKESSVEKHSISSNIQINMRPDNKLHSSNVPGLLLCTLALFVVSFQPFDVILRKYQMRSTSATGGRHLLQYSNAEQGNRNEYLLAACLGLSHWCAAFALIWCSIHNASLKSLISLLLRKIQASITHLIHKKISINRTVNDLKKCLMDINEDQDQFTLKLKDLIEEYGCSFKINLINKFVQFNVFVVVIVINFFKSNSYRKHVLNETEKIRIYLLTVVLGRSVIDPSSYSKLEIMWYKVLLYSLSWNAEINSDTVLSKLVLALSIPTRFIRRYLLNRLFKSVAVHKDLVSTDLCVLLMNNHARELFIKTNPQALMNKFYQHNLDKLINLKKQNLVNCYFMVHAQQTIEMASQIIMDKKSDNAIYEQLTNIISCCPTFLNERESKHFSLWSTLLLGLLKKEYNSCLDKVAIQLIDHYKNMIENGNIYDRNFSLNLSIILQLMTSTFRLCGRNEDKVFHDMNIQCIHDLLSGSDMNVVFQMILKLSLERIIEALNTYKSSKFASLSNVIYYTNAYSRQLSKPRKEEPNIGLEMVPRFDKLLQELCQLNPLRHVSNSFIDDNTTNEFSDRNIKVLKDFQYQLIENFSFDRDFRLRSQ